MRGPGRPSNLTDEVIERTEKGMSEGFGLSTVIEAQSLEPRTARSWKARGDDDLARGDVDTIYARFAAAVKRARSKGAMEGLERLRKLGKDDWKAEAWTLERLYPDVYGQRTHVTIQEGGHDDEASLAVEEEDLEHLTPEERALVDRLLEEIERANASLEELLAVARERARDEDPRVEGDAAADEDPPSGRRQRRRP